MAAITGFLFAAFFHLPKDESAYFVLVISLCFLLLAAFERFVLEKRKGHRKPGYALGKALVLTVSFLLWLTVYDDILINDTEKIIFTSLMVLPLPIFFYVGFYYGNKPESVDNQAESG